MRAARIAVACLCAACGGSAMNGGGDGGTVWWTTCGPPTCSPDGAVPDSGLPHCAPGQAGTACSTPGAECDPYAPCDAHLLCSDKDPKTGPGGCPISRARFKKDIRFLSPPELRQYSRALLDLPLATFRYRSGDDRTHLGFLIDGHESLAGVEGDHVDLYGYTSMAVAALQVQQQQIAELRAELAALRRQMARRRR